MGLQCPWYSLQSLRSCWGSSMHFNGRQYKWQRTVLKEPRRGWYSVSVIPVSEDIRLDFTGWGICHFPFLHPFPYAFLALRSCVCLWQPFLRCRPHQNELTEPLLHEPVSLCLSTTVHLCCAFPRRVSSGVYHVLVHPCSPGSWSTVSYWLTKTLYAFSVAVLVAQLYPPVPPCRL